MKSKFGVLISAIGEYVIQIEAPAILFLLVTLLAAQTSHSFTHMHTFIVIAVHTLFMLIF
jgi:hypothetical protein